jgi:hypothetical protein
VEKQLAKKSTMGSHWEESSYTVLCQLHRRVQNVRNALEVRRQNGHVATKKYIEELDAIAGQLKVLDMQCPIRPQKNKTRDP